MFFPEGMGRETSDRGIAVFSAGPLENLEGLHAATEVAISARKLLRVSISRGLLSTKIEKRTNRHGGAIHVDETRTLL